MNKNNIGSTLLISALIFIGAFFLGRYSLNFYGERPLLEVHKSTKKEESKIDSLENKNKVIDSRINKHYKNKERIYEEYIQDTTALSTMEFDSLSKLFTDFYPTY